MTALAQITDPFGEITTYTRLVPIVATAPSTQEEIESNFKSHFKSFLMFS